jgi:hypothetical protein
MPEQINEESETSCALGVTSLLCVLLGPFLSIGIGAILQRTDGGGASWAPVGLVVALLVYGAITILGTVLASRSLRQKEKFPTVGYIGLWLNGILAFCFVMLCVAACWKIISR